MLKCIDPNCGKVYSQDSVLDQIDEDQGVQNFFCECGQPLGQISRQSEPKGTWAVNEGGRLTKIPVVKITNFLAEPEEPILRLRRRESDSGPNSNQASREVSR